MKRTSLPFIVFFLININSLFSQVKNYIPVLKPVQYEKTKETFENIARKFEQKNNHEAAEIFRSFALGGHGSGFVYVDTDGENYIITNRHVVANSEFVNLEFAGKGSTKILYESCPIVYTDDELDLAVVKFPENEKVFTKSFSLSSAKQPDGREIWSAGFPGLLGKPMWQFAKGNITNEEAYVDQLVAPEVSYLIQHSASIDPGNSGGPLLIKDENGVEGYSVIGINTWTITNRQNTFFSIPSKNIPQVIENARKAIALKANKDSLRVQLIRQCKLFAAEVNSDKPKWGKVKGNISYAFVGNKGWDSFIKMLQESDAETLKELESKFFDYSPIETMRYALLYQIWKKIYNVKDKLSAVQYKGINIADEAQFAKAKPVRTSFTINGTEQEIEWTFEHGHWRISNFDLDKMYKNSKSDDYYTSTKKKSDKDGPSPAYVGFAAFTSPYTICDDDDLNKNFNLMGVGGAFNFTVHKFTMYTRVSSLSINNKMKSPPSTTTEVSAKFLYVSHGVIINFSLKKFSPYILSGFSYTVFSETGKYNSYSKSNQFETLGMQCGAGFRYKLTKKLGIFCEGSYYSDTIIPAFLDSYRASSPYEDGLSTFQCTVGVSLDFRKR